MSAQEVESILSQVERLSPQEQAQLMSRIAELLTKAGKKGKPHSFVYGKYRDAPGQMSTEEDFRIAEWHPTEKDLNGP
jgi:hypothetical protein